MEKLHLTLLKAANWLLAGVLVLIGFSCSDEEGGGSIVCEYGVPYAQFQIKGKVKDTKGNPIPDIQVRIYSNDRHDYWMRNVTDPQGYPLPGILILTDPGHTANLETAPESFPAITDQSGRYRFTYDNAAATKHKIHTTPFLDFWNYPDACSRDSAEVDFSEIELTNGKGMLIGKGSKEVNFQLKYKY